MNCQQFREQLDTALDERRRVFSSMNSPEITDAVAHAASCADCRAVYEEHVLLETALTAWKPEQLSVDVTDRVIEAARREGLISSNGSTVPIEVLQNGAPTALTNFPQNSVTDLPVPTGSLDRRSIWPTVVTVALVLLAVLIVFREKPGGIVKQDQTPEPLFPDPQPQGLGESQDQLADIGDLVADAQSAWQGITSQVTHQASGLSVFVPDLKKELGISDVTDSSATPTDESSSNESSEPRRSSKPSAVEKAFQFLFDNAEPAGSRTTQRNNDSAERRFSDSAIQRTGCSNESLDIV